MDVISQHLEWNGNDKSKGSCAVTLFRQASEWIQQQKPVLVAFNAAILQVRDFIVHRFQHTWPIVCTWLLHLGKVIPYTFYTVVGLLSQRHGLISSMVDVNPSLWLFGAAFLSSLQWNHFQCSSSLVISHTQQKPYLQSKSLNTAVANFVVVRSNAGLINIFKFHTMESGTWIIGRML